MSEEEKNLRKQFLKERDLVNGLLGDLHIDLILYSFLENILEGDELLPEEICPSDFLIYLNRHFENHFNRLLDAWHNAERIYVTMITKKTGA